MNNDILDLMWLGVIEKVGQILLEDPNMTRDKHDEIMKKIRVIREVRH